MSYLSGKNIVLGVGGGIAVYRACELARLLGKRGANVRVVMTERAREFVTPMTFQALTGNPVLLDLFDLHQATKFGHLDYGHAAKLVIVAPATANVVARIRGGFADDPLTASLLASTCPVLLAPAMNSTMWENRQTQENMRALLADGRFFQVGPNHGMLAEGIMGSGRLAEPLEIVEAAERLMAPRDFAGKKVLITAGPTREHLDPVRYLSNPSTGRMGYALARAAAMRGASVQLVSGPCEIPVPAGVEVIRVTSAEQMAAAVFSRLEGLDLFIATAAVADQRPKTCAPQKEKKREGEELLTLVRTPDILAGVGQRPTGGRPIRVGFAAETEQVEAHAREKLERKNLDWICANDVSKPGVGFGAETNRLLLLSRTGERVELTETTKEILAHQILDRLV